MEINHREEMNKAITAHGTHGPTVAKDLWDGIVLLTPTFELQDAAEKVVRSYHLKMSDPKIWAAIQEYSEKLYDFENWG